MRFLFVVGVLGALELFGNICPKVKELVSSKRKKFCEGGNKWQSQKALGARPLSLQVSSLTKKLSTHLTSI